MGYHRDSFYEIKRAFQVGGIAGLVERPASETGLSCDRSRDPCATRSNTRPVASSGSPMTCGCKAIR
jgi:hypothetical protein